MSFLDKFDTDMHEFVRDQVVNSLRSKPTSGKVAVLFVVQRAKSALASAFIDGEQAPKFRTLIETTEQNWAQAVDYAAELMSERPEGHQLSLEYPKP